MDEKTTLEIIAPSIEEAVEKGLQQLGLSKESVDIEILDSGGKGFLGLGTRQARIRLILKTATEDVQTLPKPKPGLGELQSTKVSEKVDTPSTIQKPVKAQDRPGTKPAAKPRPQPAKQPEGQINQAFVEMTDEQVLKVTEQVTRELLEKMSVKARIKTSLLPPQDDQDQQGVMVEVQGDDLSILIGRRSETLNALQYIASLIIAKELGHWIPILIDVQGYRARRERQLRVLARRMAEQVAQTGRKMALEPMPANERRIIHLELRDHPDVATESVGEEPNRKVTIYSKKYNR